MNNGEAGFSLCLHPMSEYYPNLERSESVSGNVEGGHFHITEEFKEFLILQYSICQSFVFYTFPEDHPGM